MSYNVDFFGNGDSDRLGSEPRKKDEERFRIHEREPNTGKSYNGDFFLRRFHNDTDDWYPLLKSQERVKNAVQIREKEAARGLIKIGTMRDSRTNTHDTTI